MNRRELQSRLCFRWLAFAALEGAVRCRSCARGGCCGCRLLAECSSRSSGLNKLSALVCSFRKMLWKAPITQPTIFKEFSSVRIVDVAVGGNVCLNLSIGFRKEALAHGITCMRESSCLLTHPRYSTPVTKVPPSFRDEEVTAVLLSLPRRLCSAHCPVLRNGSNHRTVVCIACPVMNVLVIAVHIEPVHIIT